MNATWILSANASRARFFSQMPSSDSWEEINDMVNEAVRMRSLEISETDKRGPTAATKSIHNVGGATPNKTYEPPVSPEKQQAELFARDIADYLLQAHREKRFEKLSLVVSPKFLGALRKFMAPELESAVSLEIDKDYTHFNAQELRQQIQAHLSKS